MFYGVKSGIPPIGRRYPPFFGSYVIIKYSLGITSEKGIFMAPLYVSIASKQRNQLYILCRLVILGERCGKRLDFIAKKKAELMGTSKLLFVTRFKCHIKENSSTLFGSSLLVS